MSYNNNNNNHSSNNRRGGFGNRSRGRGRGGGRGGGRSYGGGGGGGAGMPGNEVCRNFMDGGKCSRQPCRFPHVFKKIGETRGHRGAVKDVVMWEARQQLFTAGADGTIKLWDCASWQELTTLQADEDGPGSPSAAGGGVGGSRGSGGDGPPTHREGVVALVIVGPFLFAGFDGAFALNPALAVGKVRGWNLENPSAPPFTFLASDALPFAHTQNVLALACSTDARTGVPTLFSGSADGSIRYWQLDAATNQFQCRGMLEGHIRGVTRLKTFVLGATPILASASVDSTIRLWDLTTYQCVTVLSSAPAGGAAPGAEPRGHTDAVMDLEFWVNQNETFLISGGLDAEVIVWSLAPPFAQLFRETQDTKVTSLCGAQDAAQAPILLIGAMDGSITVKELPSFAYKTTLRPSANQGHQDAVRRIATGPHNTFFSAGNDRRAIAWQITGDVASIQQS